MPLHLIVQKQIKSLVVRVVKEGLAAAQFEEGFLFLFCIFFILVYCSERLACLVLESLILLLLLQTIYGDNYCYGVILRFCGNAFY